jgi:hypothetical protein
LLSAGQITQWKHCETNVNANFADKESHYQPAEIRGFTGENMKTRGEKGKEKEKGGCPP